MPTDKELSTALTADLLTTLDTWGAANKGAGKINPGVAVGSGMSLVVSVIRACSDQGMRRALVEECLAALIETTDPGIACMVIPCGPDAERSALAEVVPEGHA